MPSAQLVSWMSEPIDPMIQWTAPPGDYKRRQVETTLQEVSTKTAEQELKAEIEQARQMLTLEADWDGEGSPAYSEETLDRAITFLATHSEQLALQGLHPPAPKIGPGPDGSIDLHWKRQSWELLVNIPADANEMAVFYGDNYGAQKIRGSFDPHTFNFGIAIWLMN